MFVPRNDFIARNYQRFSLVVPTIYIPERSASTPRLGNCVRGISIRVKVHLKINVHPLENLRRDLQLPWITQRKFFAISLKN